MKRKSDMSFMRKRMEKENAKRTPHLVQVPETGWPAEHEGIIEVWLSNRFMVQVYDEGNGVLRVSCNRTSIDQHGEWMQDITWDDLMQIKRQIGRADAYAVEVLPEDSHIVNVANMRHFWILPVFVCGWRKGSLTNQQKKEATQ